ncbi:hypothetical protein BKA65DRAFT_399139 [Rhexocercosporidium sp. MPI-PUGE-AT-0058]|nr:hypothetical protein BKA65DRAFT_399139 [Rhexocercosporidium sp. MPI-PUGE-AT-0058]
MPLGIQYRNKSIYGEDSEVFSPDRWADVAPRTWELLTFGSGPRVFPGSKLTLVQA